MIRIVLVRHGQTEWNADAASIEGERFRGRIDLSLNQLGMEQAKAIRKRLAHEKIAAIYTSPLKRAMQTIEPIAKYLSLEPKPLEGFIDINYGKWQGESHSRVADIYADLYQGWLQQPHLTQPPDGESLKEVLNRSTKALYQILTMHENQAVLIAAHQVVNKVLVCSMLGLDSSHFWRIRQDNGCINIFEYKEDVFNAILINCISYLD